MLTKLNEMFTKSLGLSPELWLYVLLGVVGLAFLVTLIGGLAAGEFKKIKSLMKTAASNPKLAVNSMKQMPVAIKKQYKFARMTNAEPSVYVTEQICVEAPYKSSLISKIWVVTLAATVLCAIIGYAVSPLALCVVEDPGEDEAALANAMWLLPVFIAAVGGFLTFLGGLIGCLAHSGAKKTYERFAAAIDGDNKGAAEQPQMQMPNAGAAAFAQQPAAEPVQPAADEGAVNYEDAQPAFEAAEPQQDAGYEQPAYEAAEPAYEAAEPVYEAAAPVMDEPQESEEDIRRRAREEAIARARAEQEAQAQAAAQAAAQAQAAAAQAQAAATAQAAAQAQAAAAQAQAAAAQAQAAQAHAATSSADDIIARIEQIDREGAPRETMREVATLLQKERAKPENKTPEQQKKLNEALSKLLKAMSSAGRK